MTENPVKIKMWGYSWENYSLTNCKGSLYCRAPIWGSSALLDAISLGTRLPGAGQRGRRKGETSTTLRMQGALAGTAHSGRTLLREWRDCINIDERLDIISAVHIFVTFQFFKFIYPVGAIDLCDSDLKLWSIYPLLYYYLSKFAFYVI